MKKLIIVFAMTGILSLATACSSPEPVAEVPTNTPIPTNTEIPTNTPEPTATETPTSTPTPTETPTNTPTPTPLPKSLVLSVRDALGNPIADTEIRVGKKLATTDENGLIELTDLDEEVEIRANVPGYYVEVVDGTLRPGDNEIDITLTSNPFSLLPQQACNENEALLFSEDFEHGKPEEIDLGGYFEIIDDVDGNKIMSMQQVGRDIAAYTERDMTRHMLRFNIKFTDRDEDGAWLAWREDWSPLDTYLLYLNTDYNYDMIRFYEKDGEYVDTRIASTFGRQKVDQWHLVEIGTVDDETIVYLDGTVIAKFTDRNPAPVGGFSFGQAAYDGQEQPSAPIYFDNIRVCGIPDGIAPYDAEAALPPAVEEVAAEAETGTDATEDSTLPTPVPLPTTAAEPTQAPIVINPQVTLVSAAQVGNCAWELHFRATGFAPNSWLTESTSGQETDCNGYTSDMTFTSGSNIPTTTNLNGSVEWKITVPYYGNFTSTFTDGAGNTGSTNYTITNTREVGPTPTSVPIEARPTLQSEAAAGVPNVRIVSITKTGECSWEVHIELTGFTPNSPLNEVTTGTATDCIGNVFTVEYSGAIGQTDGTGWNGGISTFTEHGVFTMTVTDGAGITATTTFQVFP